MIPQGIYLDIIYDIYEYDKGSQILDRNMKITINFNRKLLTIEKKESMDLKREVHIIRVQ